MINENMFSIILIPSFVFCIGVAIVDTLETNGRISNGLMKAIVMSLFPFSFLVGLVLAVIS